MIPITFRYLSIFTKNATKLPTMLTFPLCQTKLFSPFCDTRKPIHDHPKQDANRQSQNQNEQRSEVHDRSRNPGQTWRKHGPGCKNDHGHHHEGHHHGPAFKQDRKHKNDTPANMKLSKLTFEQLIEINTEDALKYAQMIYEREEQGLRELQAEREETLKYLGFFKKIEQDIKQKERILQEHVDQFEEQLLLSEKRAQKEVQSTDTSAILQLAKEFIEVADCVDKCRKLAEEVSESDIYILLILQLEQLIKNVMAKYEIEEFDPTDQPYDPNYQESLSKVPTPEGAKAGYVARTMQTGYKMRGRLLRSARVVIFS